MMRRFFLPSTNRFPPIANRQFLVVISFQIRDLLNVEMLRHLQYGQIIKKGGQLLEQIPDELIFGGDVRLVVLNNILKLLKPPTCANWSTRGKKPLLSQFFRFFLLNHFLRILSKRSASPSACLAEMPADSNRTVKALISLPLLLLLDKKSSLVEITFVEKLNRIDGRFWWI